MTDRSKELNELLKSKDAPPIRELTFQNIDEFLKEAYRINHHIASLNAYLKNIRESYLSTAPRPIRTSKSSQYNFLTDHDKEEVDAAATKSIREIGHNIQGLQNAEQLRQDIEKTNIQKKYKTLGGKLGSWAAGGAGRTKTIDQELDEAKSQIISEHHDNVLKYLRIKYKDCVDTQRSMMQKRLNRVLEKRKSVLANAKPRGPDLSTFSGATNHVFPATIPQYQPEELTPEQMQMFEEDHQDMLRHYEDALNQVTTTEKSLREISELQTQIMENLNTQSEHIGQIVEDAFHTTENVGQGNKELKKASERGSTAKYVFYASCLLSLTLVTWDLLI